MPEQHFALTDAAVWGVLILLVGAVWRSTVKQSDKIAEKVDGMTGDLAQIRTALTGLNGSNGLTSRVGDLEDGRDDHERRITVLETERRLHGGYTPPRPAA